MKIGLVTGEYPPMEGGVGAYTSELANALSKTGNQLHIITSRKARPESQDRSLWDIREPYDIGYGLLHPRVGRWWWSAMSTVADIVTRYDLDLVNLQYQAAAYDMVIPAINFLPWRLRDMANTVVTFHDLRTPYLFPKAGGLRYKLVQRLARTADGAIVTNDADYTTLLQGGLPGERLIQIPIGSNIEARERSDRDVEAVRRTLGLDGDTYLIGYFGFVNESKGADLLVEALARLPEPFRVVFIGGRTGSSDTARNRAFLEQLTKLIDELGVAGRVHWSGYLDQKDVSTYLYASDCMVMPYRDGASLRRGSLMAILAHGRPLITTLPSSLVDQLVHGDNVWITPVDDPGALKEAISTLASNPDIGRKIGANARETSYQFGWETIAAKTASFFKEIATKSLKRI